MAIMWTVDDPPTTTSLTSLRLQHVKPIDR
jgi:hypothetical protein